MDYGNDIVFSIEKDGKEYAGSRAEQQNDRSIGKYKESVAAYPSDRKD